METLNVISCRRMAIIQYETQEAAAKAIKGFNKFKLATNLLTVRHFDQATYAHGSHFLLPFFFVCSHAVLSPYKAVCLHLRNTHASHIVLMTAFAAFSPLPARRSIALRALPKVVRTSCLKLSRNTSRTLTRATRCVLARGRSSYCFWSFIANGEAKQVIFSPHFYILLSPHFYILLIYMYTHSLTTSCALGSRMQKYAIR